MSLKYLFKDEIILKLFTFPVLTVVITIILKFYIKDKLKIAGIILIAYSLLMLILYDESFFTYILIYPLISLIIYVLIEKLKGKL